jgi:EmrB/QacA subfamily drug resistance transporter
MTVTDSNLGLRAGSRGVPDLSAAAAGQHHGKRWWILAVLGLAQLMVVLDATVVNIALPSAQNALHFSNADRQWVVTAYSLAFGGLLLLGGRLSDLFGRKRTFVVGLIGFAAASAVGGAANSFEMLVIARAAQGALGALLAPSALSLLTTTFSEPSERGKAFGIYGAIAGAGGAIGLLLGGALTQYLNWRWCLYVNDVLAIVAVAGALSLLSNQQRQPGAHLDVPGTITAVAGLVSLVYGFSEANQRGWGDVVTIGLLVAGVVLLVAFVGIETRVNHPLLPLRVVLDRHRGGSYLAVLLAGVAIFGVFLFLTYFLQVTKAYSPVLTGLAFLPMVATLMASSAVSTTALLPRVGPRPLVSTGMLAGAVGMALLSRLGVHTSYVGGILPSLLILGVGIGLIFGSAINMATFGATQADAGVASAMVSTVQQIGGSIGTALLNTIAASAATSYLVGRAASSKAVQAAAAVHGDSVAFVVVACIFFAGAIVTASVYKGGRVELPVGAERAIAA